MSTHVDERPKSMFDIWRNIVAKGSVAVPLNATALTPLCWVEIGEVYPELVPDECRDCDVYSDPQLIRESPFVNDTGKGYLFTATDPIGGGSLKCALCCEELMNRAGANDYHYSDEDCNSLRGILTCSCGIPGCDGLWSQSFHVSSKMVHWSILRYREKYELFFEREAYELGLIRMLKDMSEHPGIYNTTRGSSYDENHASFVERVHDMLQRRPYFQDMWNELLDLGFTKAFFADSRFHVSLPDGTSLSFPIAGNWRLENATPEQLNNVEVDEEGLHWPDIDEDLSFAGLLCGDHGQFVKQKRGFPS